MNTQPPPFLELLGLDDGADLQAVRKAYAVRVKRIDLANDPHGFQALRTAYEAALQWAKRRAGPKAGPGIAVPHGLQPRQELAPLPVADAVSPDALARAVFQALVPDSAAGLQGFTDDASAARALSQALNDPRLFGLEARVCFEGHVIALLVEGWRPGHEGLFDAGCSLFGWPLDLPRLSMFGPSGEVLACAVEESIRFLRQEPARIRMQRRLIERLRDGRLPDAATQAGQAPQLQVLARSCPHWLFVVAPRAHFEQRLPAPSRPVARAQEPGWTSTPLWHPDLATFFGFLVTPLFGVLPHAINARRLGDPDLRRIAAWWLVPGLLLSFAQLVVELPIDWPGRKVTAAVQLARVWFMVIWAFTGARRQSRFVLSAFGSRYPHRRLFGWVVAKVAVSVGLWAFWPS